MRVLKPLWASILASPSQTLGTAGRREGKDIGTFSGLSVVEIPWGRFRTGTVPTGASLTVLATHVTPIDHVVLSSQQLARSLKPRAVTSSAHAWILLASPTVRAS
jgi:hypothetical protein